MKNPRKEVMYGTILYSLYIEQETVDWNRLKFKTWRYDILVRYLSIYSTDYLSFNIILQQQFVEKSS